MAQYPLRAATPGIVQTIEIRTGEQVSPGQVLARIEIMKMEIPVESPAAGRVLSINVRPGATVAEGDLLMTLEL